MAQKFITKEYTTSAELKDCRKRLGLTQADFATLVGVSKPTVERWEMSKDRITGPIAMLVPFLTEDYLESRRIPDRKTSLRLWYMYKETPCTVIDVDDSEQKIKIKNYANNPQFMAFGINQNPNYSDYQDFLKSRCFPETRDKMKLILEDLDLPFYDPFLIIKKTKGKMAEDDFWIKIEE